MEQQEPTKFHYYAFVFTASNAFQTVTASTYIGLVENLVTVPQIESAKISANVGKSAVLVGLFYMGHMTADEVNPTPVGRFADDKARIDESAPTHSYLDCSDDNTLNAGYARCQRCTELDLALLNRWSRGIRD